MQEREYVANMKLASHVAQDILLPALVEHMKREIDRVLPELKGYHERIATLETEVTMLKTAAQMQVLEKIDVGL